jgi:hypothetical protein
MLSLQLHHGSVYTPFSISSNTSFHAFKMSVRDELNLLELRIPTLQCKIKKDVSEDGVQMSFFNLKPNQKLMVLGEKNNNNHSMISQKQKEDEMLKKQQKEKEYAEFRAPIHRRMEKQVAQVAAESERQAKCTKSTNTEKDSILFKWYCHIGDFTRAEQLYRCTSHQIDFGDARFMQSCLLATAKSGNLELFQYLISRAFSRIPTAIQSPDGSETIIQRVMPFNYCSLLFPFALDGRHHNQGYTVLWYVLHYGRLSILKYLLENEEFKQKLLFCWCRRLNREEREKCKLIDCFSRTELPLPDFMREAPLEDKREENQHELKMHLKYCILQLIMKDIIAPIAWSQTETLEYAIHFLQKERWFDYGSLYRIIDAAAFGSEANNGGHDVIILDRAMRAWIPNKIIPLEDEKTMNSMEFLDVAHQILRENQEITEFPRKTEERKENEDDDDDGENDNHVINNHTVYTSVNKLILHHMYLSKKQSYNGFTISLDCLARRARMRLNIPILEFLRTQCGYKLMWNHLVGDATFNTTLLKYFINEKIVTEENTPLFKERLEDFLANCLKKRHNAWNDSVNELIEFILQKQFTPTIPDHLVTRFHAIQSKLEAAEQRADLIARGLAGQMKSIMKLAGQTLEPQRLISYSSNVSSMQYIDDNNYYTFPFDIARMIVKRMCKTDGIREIQVKQYSNRLFGEEWRNVYAEQVQKTEQEEKEREMDYKRKREEENTKEQEELRLRNEERLQEIRRQFDETHRLAMISKAKWDNNNNNMKD